MGNICEKLFNQIFQTDDTIGFKFNIQQNLRA